MLCLWRRLAFSLRNRDSRVSRASLAHRPRKVQPVPPTGDQQTPFLSLKVWERLRRSARSYLPPRRLEGSLKSFWIIAKRQAGESLSTSGPSVVPPASLCSYQEGGSRLTAWRTKRIAEESLHGLTCHPSRTPSPSKPRRNTHVEKDRSEIGHRRNVAREPAGHRADA